MGILLCCGQMAAAQNRQISGMVTFADSTKTSLGSTVNVKGTNISTTTNKAGKYALSVPSSATVLVFSFVGMQPLEEEIKGRAIINVVFLRTSSNFARMTHGFDTSGPTARAST